MARSNSDRRSSSDVLGSPRPASRAVSPGEKYGRFVHELGLSPREQEIVCRLADDYSEFAIGQDLGIAKDTVHTYIRRIYAKLGVRNRVQLVVRLLKPVLDNPTDIQKMPKR